MMKNAGIMPVIGQSNCWKHPGILPEVQRERTCKCPTEKYRKPKTTFLKDRNPLKQPLTKIGTLNQLLTNPKQTSKRIGIL